MSCKKVNFGVNQKLMARNIPVEQGSAHLAPAAQTAHVIVEEYVEEASAFVPQPGLRRDREGRKEKIGGRREKGEVGRGKEEGETGKVEDQAPYLIVLSAKNRERLKEYAGKLHTYLKHIQSNSQIINHQSSIINLCDLAYTLQVGREAMEHRLALVTSSLQKLTKKLAYYLQGTGDLKNVFQTNTNTSIGKTKLLAEGNSGEAFIQAAIDSREFDKLGQLWVSGVDIDWKLVNRETGLKRIALPTYPFARERYWISKPERESPNHSPKGGFPFHSNHPNLPRLHPLVHSNTSDSSEQRFSSTFTGEEFFWADRVLKGEKVLSGAAYLEMARVAVEQSVGSMEDDQARIQLTNVVWARPIVANCHAQAVHIGLFPEENEKIRYEIYTEVENSEDDVNKIPERDWSRTCRSDQWIVHSQGVVNFKFPDKIPALDLKGLQEGCNQTRLSAEQCNKTFKRMGIDYGSGQQSIESAFVGKNQVLVKVSLPSSVLDTPNQYVLHPSLMESARHASIGLFFESKSDSSSPFPYLPIALHEFEILAPCTTSMWALIRYSDGCQPEDSELVVDIDWSDEEGTICVRKKGLAFQAVSQPSISQDSFSPLPLGVSKKC